MRGMFSRWTAVGVTAGVLAVAGCVSAPVALLNDGEQALPDYKNWSHFLHGVQRPDAKQVRDIYLNDTAKKASHVTGFPLGSTMVMENYEAQINPDGSLKTGPDGKLVKGKLVAIFVQGKGAGWGQSALDALKNGEWVYTAYLPTGAKGPQDLNTCRACHLPLKDKDFVHRYDEYFDKTR